jgi:hypothetical protein
MLKMSPARRDPPVFQVVGEVVELAVGALDEGEVVWGFPAAQPAADEVRVLDALDGPLGGLEVQYLGHEPLDQGRVVDRDQGVVDPVRAHPARVAWPGALTARSSTTTRRTSP